MTTKSHDYNLPLQIYSKKPNNSTKQTSAETTINLENDFWKDCVDIKQTQINSVSDSDYSELISYKGKYIVYVSL